MILSSKSKYSLEGLAMLIASVEKYDVIKLSDYSFEFEDAEASVKGYVRCWFDEQKQTYENPPFCDLVDAVCCVYSVRIDFDEKTTHLTINELKKLDNLVNKYLT